MMRWEAHTCLPLHPDASLAPLDRFRALGVDYVSVNVGMDMNPVGQILTVLAAFRTRIAAHPERFVLVSTVADIERAARAGRLAVGFDLEGSMPLLDRPEMAQVYRDLGVRQIHFAYNRDNSVAGGCHDLDHGLTPLGRRMVAAVNDAGLLMDCSHTGRRSTLEIMASSRHPVIFSHANPLALVEHGRNVTDEQIRACAATGGCVCVSGVSAFVGTRTPSAGDVARHAAYVADVAGIAHAGIGLDIGFDEPGLDDTPPGDFDREYWWPRAAGYDRGLAPMAYAPLETWRELPAALERLGMSSVETEQVMGGNMMRVASAVWTS
jgi:membrane dipeptidase